MSEAWTWCRIGSCHRHQNCMYHPCRASVLPSEFARVSGAAAERRTIVAWLRCEAATWDDGSRETLQNCADAIERGEHALAQGIEAATGGETRSGSTEGESPVPEGDAPNPYPLPPISTGGRDG
jgi:hypothetical protein